MNTLWSNFRSFLRSEEGVTAIEYGLIAALIAVAIIGAVTAIGTDLGGLFQALADAIEGTPRPPAGG